MSLGSGVVSGVVWFEGWIGDQGVICLENSMVIGFTGWPIRYGFSVMWLSAFPKFSHEVVESFFA